MARFVPAPRSIPRFVGSLLVLVAAVLGLTQSPVSAHNSLVESNPRDGAVLASVPIEWVLVFKNDVPLASASAEVVAATGERTQLPAPRHGTSQREILFSLPQNLAGVVTARWRLVNTDGHVVSARITFTVGTTMTTTPATVSPTVSIDPPVRSDAVVTDSTGDSTPELPRFLLRVVGFAAIVAFGGLVLNALLFGSRFSAFDRVGTLTLVASSALVVSPLGQLLVFLDDARDHGIIGSVPRIADALDTTAGSMIFLRTLIGAVILVAVVIGVSVVSRPMLALSGCYLFALAYVGHSRSMAWPVLGVPADVVHTASVAVWLGGLAVFVLVVLPQLAPHDALTEFRRYGDVARFAVLAIVVTGIAQTLRLHGTVITLVTEPHGRWLLAKLAFVALMLKIGDVNRRRLLVGLPQTEGAVLRHVEVIRRASLTEIATGGAVMLLTAFLVTSSFA